jgi:hypothetical protein
LSLSTNSVTRLNISTTGVIDTQANPITNCPTTAKAWVNFNGTTATPSTIRSSYNVSSITKHGTGNYTVNFATAMANANYSVAGSASSAIAQLIVSPFSAATMGLQSCQVYVSNTATAGDNAVVCVQVFGN